MYVGPNLTIIDWFLIEIYNNNNGTHKPLWRGETVWSSLYLRLN